MSLKEINIGSLGQVITGNTPPKKDPKNYGGSHPFVKPTDMTIGKRFVDKWDETYSEKAFEKYKRSLIPSGATGVVTIGTVGEKIFQSNQDCFTNQSVNVVIPNEDYDKDYVFYILKLNLNKVLSANPGTSSGRHHVSKSNFCSIKIDVVSCKKAQKKIASILSAYDDLIENNLKRIQLLEEAAQRIYKEWFVDFKFPNHENTAIDKETGLPEGWRKCKFEDIFVVKNGYAFKSNSYKDKGIPLIRTRDYSSNYHVNIQEKIFIDENSDKKFNKYHLKKMDILLIMVGASIGKYGIILQKDLPAFQNQNQWALRTKEGFELYEYYKVYNIRYIVNHLLKKRTGAARDFLRASFLKEIEITIPNTINIVEFNKVTESILEEINNLLTQNQTLKESRDLLLPRLMNRTL
jgi:type I restriction enzyme S subunit